jgi:hypothetical protein
VQARSDEEEPDWDKEMSIFKQRTMAPNQLATLRELESKVSLGRVRAAVVQVLRLSYHTVFQLSSHMSCIVRRGRMMQLQ